MAYTSHCVFPLTTMVLILMAGCGSSYEEDEPWIIEPSCKRESTVPVADSGIKNPYYNGYMLVREEKDSPFSPQVIDYRYEPQDMTIYVTIDFLDRSYAWRITQSIDANGRLTGGTKDVGSFGPLSGLSSYTLLSDSEGKISRFERDYGDERVFNYEQSRLKDVQFLDNNITQALIYDYDELSQLVSVKETRGRDVHLHYFSCNELNQVTAVYQEAIVHFSNGPAFRNKGHYEFDYDEYGNVIEIRDYTLRELQTTTLEYVQTDYPVFNHSLMRLAIGPVWQSRQMVY